MFWQVLEKNYLITVLRNQRGSVNFCTNYYETILIKFAELIFKVWDEVVWINHKDICYYHFGDGS